MSFIIIIMGGFGFYNLLWILSDFSMEIHSLGNTQVNLCKMMFHVAGLASWSHAIRPGPSQAKIFPEMKNAKEKTRIPPAKVSTGNVQSAAFVENSTKHLYSNNKTFEIWWTFGEIFKSVPWPPWPLHAPRPRSLPKSSSVEYPHQT